MIPSQSVAQVAGKKPNILFLPRLKDESVLVDVMPFLTSRYQYHFADLLIKHLLEPHQSTILLMHPDNPETLKNDGFFIYGMLNCLFTSETQLFFYSKLSNMSLSKVCI